MELTTNVKSRRKMASLFMMSKIQNLNGTHNGIGFQYIEDKLFMMSKIQNLNGTHNSRGRFEREV